MTKQKPLKVAVYSGEVPGPTFIERLIDGLAKAGHTIYLFGIKTGRVPKRARVKNVSYRQDRAHKFLYLVRYTILLTLFKYQKKRQLDALLKARSKNLLNAKVKSYPVLWYQPDIFHVQWAKGLDEWVWVQTFGMNLVVSFLGTHINYSPVTIPKIGLMYKKYFPIVDGFHAVSKAIALKGAQYRADGDKIKVVYSGMNLNQFDSHGVKKDNKQFKMVSVGRTHWVKGYSYAIDACDILNTSDFQFEYVIVGGLGDIELEYQIHDLGLSDKVKLLGRLPFEQVRQLMHEADLLILSSVEEGIANVVLEAMASKTLVLSTECGGMDEVIKNNVNGFLVPIRDPKAMAEAVVRISLLPREEMDFIIERAAETVGRQHSEQQMIEGMMELYDEVCYPERSRGVL